MQDFVRKARTGRRVVGFAAGLAALAVAGVAPASAPGSSFIATTGCLEHQAFVDGDDAAVAARLPKRYTPVRDGSSGRPLLFVRALRCQAVTLDGRTGPATMASFGVVIDSPDGRGCASGAPVLGSVKGDVPPVCNWYTLFFLANDRRVVDWLRDGSPGFPAVYVPGLLFDLRAFDPAQGGAPFHFKAPAPSPFTIDEIGRERPGQLSVRGGYWADTPQGTVKLAFSSDDLISGDATGIVHAAPHSQMAALFGSDERSYAPGYSLVSAERWAHAAYRKQILGPAPNTDSFSGSCSLQGTVNFTPPATNTAMPLSYSYEDGRGTCTGNLDGRSLSNVPVTVRQSGPSYGSCSQASTTAPGQGAITFADGTTIRYTLDFTSALTEVNFDFYGERSGFASGQGTFLTPRTRPDVALQCAGQGASQVPLDISLKTDTPLVSEHQAQDQAARTRLRLAVRPANVRVGRRRTFTFRVRTAGGRPVSRVLIRFAGRRARTGRRGAARIVTIPHHPGRLTARATKPGFRAARATIRVRRK